MYLRHRRKPETYRSNLRSQLNPVLLAALFLMQTLINGCSPSLNWREVLVGQMVAMLPCKPDRAQRSVTLAETSVNIDMAGCEADGALYAVSHVHLADPGSAGDVVRNWRSATLSNMRAIERLTATGEGAGNHADIMSSGATATPPIRVHGVKADGTPVQAALSWLISGGDVYHLAVYGQTLTPAHTETIFTQSRIR